MFFNSIPISKNIKKMYNISSNKYNYVQSLHILVN